MDSKGILKGEPTEMAGEMIGAISGIKYTESGFELYEYEKESAKYKEIEETGTTVIEGFGFNINPTAYLDGYVLIVNEEAGNKAEIVKAFNEYFGK